MLSVFVDWNLVVNVVLKFLLSACGMCVNEEGRKEIWSPVWLQSTFILNKEQSSKKTLRSKL